MTVVISTLSRHCDSDYTWDDIIVHYLTFLWFEETYNANILCGRLSWKTSFTLYSPDSSLIRVIEWPSLTHPAGCHVGTEPASFQLWARMTNWNATTCAPSPLSYQTIKHVRRQEETVSCLVREAFSPVQKSRS